MFGNTTDVFPFTSRHHEYTFLRECRIISQKETQVVFMALGLQANITPNSNRSCAYSNFLK